MVVLRDVNCLLLNFTVNMNLRRRIFYLNEKVLKDRSDVIILRKDLISTLT